MHFLFLIFLLLIVAISVVYFIAYVITRERTYLATIGAIWFFTIAGCIALSVIADFDRPIKLTTKDIYGTYRIDTNFYNGANARWQYNRYRLIITPTDSLYVKTYNDKGILQNTNCYQIKYSNPNFGTWYVDSAKHHLLINMPTLYRSHSKYYYVLKSSRYSNMFFRKIEE